MYLAQANYALWIDHTDGNLVMDFMTLVPEMNKLAESSPGFIWRYVGLPDNSDVVAVFQDERVIFNMSVWRSLHDLKHFAFHAPHNKVMGQRHTWFQRSPEKTSVLWWVAEDHLPTVGEAKEKLDRINELGPTPEAFGFASVFDPPG